MRLSRRLALGATVVALLVGACSSGGGSKPTVKIGSVGFDEAKVMAEIYAQALEADGYTVDRSGIGLGARSVVAPAIESGQIDLQPEYIGSRLGVTYGGTPTGDAAANATALQAKLDRRQPDAARLHAGTGHERLRRPFRHGGLARSDQDERHDCGPGSAQLGIRARTARPTRSAALRVVPCRAATASRRRRSTAQRSSSACSTPMADALKNGTIDVAELCSTQPDIIVNGWVILADDKSTQPADNIAPIVRNDLLDKVPDKAAFEKILNDVSAQIDTPTLASLYKQVAVDHLDAADVAHDWLKAKGFIQ